MGFDTLFCDRVMAAELRVVFLFQAEDGIRDPLWSRGLGYVYKSQLLLQEETSLLLQEKRCLLLQQKTSLLLQQKTSLHWLTCRPALTFVGRVYVG